MSKYIVKFTQLDTISKFFFAFLLIPYLTSLATCLLFFVDGIKVIIDSHNDTQALGAFGGIYGFVESLLSLGAAAISTFVFILLVNFSAKYNSKFVYRIILLCIVAVFILAESLVIVSVYG